MLAANHKPTVGLEIGCDYTVSQFSYDQASLPTPCSIPVDKRPQERTVLLSGTDYPGAMNICLISIFCQSLLPWFQTHKGQMSEALTLSGTPV